MKTQTKNIRLSLALLLFAIFALTPAANAAQIWTNQEDYGPDEVVYISGTGFDIYSVITVTIVGPEEWGADQFSTLDSPWWVYWSFTEPDRFDIGYLKVKCGGTFYVTATDGTNTATTTFTDTKGLTITFAGTGSGSVLVEVDNDNNGDIDETHTIYGTTSYSGSNKFGNNAQVTLTGTADVGSSFVDWSGYVNSSSNSISFNLNNADRDVTVTFDLASSNTSPTAAFSWSPEPQDEGSPVDFTDESTDSDGSIVSWSWDFGDTGTSTDQNPSHTYSAGGTYTVQLTVTDNDGYTDTVSHDVTINDAPVETADVTFDQTGVGGDFAGVVVTIDGIPYGVLDLPVTITKDVDDTISFEYYSPLGVDADKQYVWTSTSGLSSVQSDTIVVPSGGGSVTGIYGIQYYVTFDQTGLDATADGTVVTVDGDAKGYGDLPFSKWVNAGGSVGYAYEGTVDSIIDDVRFRLDNVTGPTSPATINGAGTIVGNYVIQYYLYLGCDPSGTGTQNTEGWYDAGTYASISTDENVDIVTGESRYHFTDWSTDELGEIDDPEAASTTVYMDQPKTVTANYVIQYYLTLESDPSGVGTQTGEGWYDADTDASISTDENVDIVAGESRYHFTDWSTDDLLEIDDPEAASTTVLMDKAKTVTANYVTQYMVTFDQTGLDGTATGTVATYEVDLLGPTNLEFPDFPEGLWVDEGETVTYAYEILVASTTPGLQFWLSSVTGPASGFTVDSAATITGNYTELPKSALTAGGCPFDKDEGLDGQQFRLIFTQDPTDMSTYKLTASNPGQFFYNVFYVGHPGDPVSLDLEIPYPFVTQGATPIHFYSNVDVVDGCYTPLDGIDGFIITGTDTVTPNGSLGIALDDYVGKSVTITVSGNVPDTGLAYVRIHLDYGLKKNVGYTSDGSNNAEKPIGTDAVVDLDDYVFEVDGDMSDALVIQNENVFKKIPGFGGMVLDGLGDPVYLASITITGPEGSTVVTTDEDGFYYLYYKHKGKEAEFTVACSGQSETVPMKANKYVEVNFTVP